MCKQLTTYNRVAGYLNKVFDLLNAEYFGGELPRPTITIQSTPRAYGHFTVNEAWSSKTGSSHEINLGAGTLSRPIEETVATLLHEMVHYYCCIHKIKDTSRGNTYHNKNFRREAEARALHVDHDEKYGWTITSPTEELLDFIIANELTDILINRNEQTAYQVPGGHSSNGPAPVVVPKKSSTRKYICPCCGMSVRATREVRIACLDCGEQLMLAG